ncbi:aquaporin [Tricharina praecox]|uniref:aquaporin n=1 Tax=Tricharina praecox TaxID=43433 RepID=UPI0022212000|nr:aquaporin [Tricharina praecox]KAI5858507.1 aquaporin [Tricharina praecox]
MKNHKMLLPLAKSSGSEQQRGTFHDNHGHLPGNGFKNHLVAAAGEFVGTFFFLFMAFAGTSVANIPSPPQSDTTRTDPEQLMYIALSFGFSLCINVWIFFRISGGLFNPVVTLGLLLIGALSGTRAAVIFLAQIVASIVSAVAVNGLFPTPLAVSTSLGVGTTLAQGVFIEAFLTFELVFCIFMLAAEKHKATFLAPIGIGLALFVAELAGVYYTGGSLNPARSFGPAVAARSFPKEHWIYWVGPALGALAAVGFYKFVKKLGYEEANPGQDRDPEETVVTVRNATSEPAGQNGRLSGTTTDGDVVVEVDPAGGIPRVLCGSMEEEKT